MRPFVIRLETERSKETVPTDTKLQVTFRPAVARDYLPPTVTSGANSDDVLPDDTGGAGGGASSVPAAGSSGQGLDWADGRNEADPDWADAELTGRRCVEGVDGVFTVSQLSIDR